MGGSTEFACALAAEVPVSCEVRLSGVWKRARRVILIAHPAVLEGDAFRALPKGGFRQRVRVNPDAEAKAVAVLGGVVSLLPSRIETMYRSPRMPCLEPTKCACPLHLATSVAKTS